MQRGGYHAAGRRERSERPEVLQQGLDPLPLQSFATMFHSHGGSSSFAVAEGSSDEDGENPFPMVCPRCHVSVVKLQSKTPINPGRWFYKCPNHDKHHSRCPKKLLFWEDEYETYLKNKGNEGTWSATPPASRPPGSLVRESVSLMQPSPPGERSSPGKAFQPSPVQGSWSPTQLSPPVGCIRRGRSFQPQSSLEGSSSATFQPCPSRSTLPTTYPASPSPVRYQEHPLDYTPTFPCHCKPSQTAGLFISWDECPGRRYYCCMRPGSDKCSDFLGWADPVLPEHITNLLRYYQDRVDELTLEVNACRKRQTELGSSLENMMKQLDFK